VQSFVIPASEQPGDIVYGGIGPAGPPEGVHTDNRWALYAVSGSPFVDELTQKNDGPGRPGIINQLPAFSFEPFRPEHLPPGRYHLGIACTPPGRETAIYWDTEIEVLSVPQGEPAGWRWTVVAEPDIETVADSESSPTLAIVGVAAIGLAGVVVAVRSRTSRSRPAPTKEHAA
jgi:hypothetical protein